MSFRSLIPITLCLVAIISLRAKPTEPADLEIYLLLGQSNMAGRDTRAFNEQTSDPHILALDSDGKWNVARDPIHKKIGRIDPGIGPGIAFATTMLAAESNTRIGLVPCAVEGSPLSRWVKSGDLYTEALERARLASKSGVIKGILWHQGETDSENEANAATYQERLTAMFRDLRSDLGDPDVPIVVGQIGDFLDPAKQPFADTVRAALRNVAASDPTIGYADSTGLADKGDRLHFTATAARSLGQRFANAMRALQMGADLPMPTEVIEIWPHNAIPGSVSGREERDLPPHGDFVQRVTNTDRPTLAFYPAAQNSNAAPALIVCPGGGYSYLAYNKEGIEIAAWLNRNGYSALVLKYRTPDNRTGALQDIQRALSVARVHADKWRIDPRQLGVIGFSAGGNLSAKASNLFESRAYSPVDDTDNQSCRPDFAILVYPAYLSKDGKIAADLNLAADIPPTLIVHSEDDMNFVPGSKLYDAALIRAGVPRAFLLYPTGGHGYALHCQGEAKAWPDDSLAWLKETLP